MVDPGDEPEKLLAAIEALGIEKVDAILLTHTHFDHVGAVAPVARATGAPVYCPELETRVLANIMDFVPWEGFGPFESYDADQTVKGGETLELAGLADRGDLHARPQPGPRHLLGAVRGRDLLRRRAVRGLRRPRRSSGRRLADAAAVDRDAAWTPTTRRRRCTPATWGSRRSAVSAPRIRSCESSPPTDEDPGSARHVRRAPGGRCAP